MKIDDRKPLISFVASVSQKFLAQCVNKSFDEKEEEKWIEKKCLIYCLSLVFYILFIYCVPGTSFHLSLLNVIKFINYYLIDPNA